MDLDRDVCYRALKARDARFDGVFYVGVKTTRIYCRPICPVRTPGQDRCQFFAHPVTAEQYGFRPCLRCRPELAPGQAAVDSVRRKAALAARRIDEGALNNGGSVETLAAELGISSRQLRRAIRQEFGVTPVELAQTRRLLLAKQLLTETRIPLIDVALASGFESVRRFNSLFRSRYDLTPMQVRKSVAPASGDDCVRLQVAYRSPYAWQPLLSFLAQRATAGVERVMGDAYFRAVAMDGHRGWIRVEQGPGGRALSVALATDLLPVLPPILGRVRRLFDVHARPDVIAAHLRSDEMLAPLIEVSPGLRVPGAFDEFELLIRAILGQQISVKAATTLAGRVAAEFGEAVATPISELDRVPPTPESLANLRKSQLTSLGIASPRAECIRTVSRAVAEGKLNLEHTIDPEGTVQSLKKLPGVGEWTAQYVAMRALHWPDAFPHGDLGLLKASRQTSPVVLHKMAEAWRPWRAYAAMTLWNSHGSDE